MTSLAADSVAPPGYSVPLIEPIRPSEPDPQIATDQEQVLEKRRRMPDETAFPWRGALLAAAVVATAAAVYALALGPKPESDRARQAISDYEHALAADDGARACSLLTSEARTQVIASGLHHGIRGGCAAVLGVVGGSTGSLVAQARAAGKGAQVDALMSASNARVVVDPTHSYAAAMPYGHPILMTRVGGQWMIDSLTGDHARLHAAPVSGANQSFAMRADAICQASERELSRFVPIVSTELKAATVGSPAPAFAAHLQTLTAKSNAVIARLAGLHPPATQGATFDAYLAAERNDSVLAGEATQLAQQGRTQDAALEFWLGVEADQGDAPAAAQLGFHVC
jgi:hypothetical protein